MDQILEWLSQYSAPVVLLLALGAALVYGIQRIVDRVIDAKFAEHDKRIELLLGRRARFEERVLLDQYEMVTGLQLRLSSIGADLNRVRSGVQVEGLMRGQEIVPLTEVYVDLQARRFLLKEPFFRLLKAQADVLLASVKAPSTPAWEQRAQEYLRLVDELRVEVDRTFGINAIDWGTVGRVDR